MYGKKHSEESKQKIKQRAKGRKPWHAGLSVGPNTGKITWNKGKKTGPNPALSERMKGNIPWNKGCSLSDEHKRKISDARKKKSKNE
jgi:hypothetical protein